MNIHNNINNNNTISINNEPTPTINMDLNNRCICTTKKGTRCKLNRKDGYYCKIHQYIITNDTIEQLIPHLKSIQPIYIDSIQQTIPYIETQTLYILEKILFPIYKDQYEDSYTKHMKDWNFQDIFKNTHTLTQQCGQNTYIILQTMVQDLEFRFRLLRKLRCCDLLHSIQKKRLFQSNYKSMIQEIPSHFTNFHKQNADKECKCCLDDFDTKKELYTCKKLTFQCKHQVCKECLKSHFKHQMTQGKCELECMYHSTDKCGGSYPKSILCELFENDNEEDQQTYDKLLEIYEINEVRKMSLVLDNFQVCPHCSRYGVQVDTGNKAIKMKIECQHCHKYWCNLCRQNYHGEKHCYALDFVDKTEQQKNEIIYTKVNTILSKAYVSSCPSCNTQYIKLDGCNLITCSTCHTKFCHCCNEKIKVKSIQGRPSVYYHFKGHEYYRGTNECNLYNSVMGGNVAGNLNYYTKRTFQELDTLMEHNPNYRKEIYKQLEKINQQKNSDYAIPLKELKQKYLPSNSMCSIM